MDTTTQDNQNGENEFVVTFRNGALQKLKALAAELDIPEDQLGEVLQKGIKIIEFAKNGKLVVEKNKERYEVDLKKI